MRIAAVLAAQRPSVGADGMRRKAMETNWLSSCVRFGNARRRPQQKTRKQLKPRRTLQNRRRNSQKNSFNTKD